MNLVDELFAVARALDGAGIEYAVCGGIAVTIHGAPRMTKVIDILVCGRIFLAWSMPSGRLASTSLRFR